LKIHVLIRFAGKTADAQCRQFDFPLAISLIIVQISGVGGVFQIRDDQFPADIPHSGEKRIGFRNQVGPMLRRRVFRIDRNEPPVRGVTVRLKQDFPADDRNETQVRIKCVDDRLEWSVLLS